MDYKYGVYDLGGRLWVRTMTAIRAARCVGVLFETKNLICVVKPLAGVR